MNKSWDHFKQKTFLRLSLVDATSFTPMRRHKIGAAFAFDHHFATAGFRLIE